MDADIIKKHCDSITSLVQNLTVLQCMLTLLAFVRHGLKER